MSSGFSYPQPIFKSSIYNPAFYLSLDASGFLTYDYAQTLYLGRNDYRLTYLTGITPGTATQGLALVPGENKDITGLGALSCSSLTVNGSSITSAPDYVLGITGGTAQNSKALVLSSTGSITSGITSLTLTGTLSAATLTGTLSTAAQTNITSVGSLTGLTINGSLTFSDGFSVKRHISWYTSKLNARHEWSRIKYPSLKFNGTTFNQDYYINITEGGADPSKAIVLNSTKDFSGIRNLTCSGTITGSTGVSTPSLSCGAITATTLNINPTTLQLRGTTVTSSATELNALAGVSAGTATNSKALVLDSTGNISGINALSAASVATSGNITVSGSINGYLACGNQTAITTVGPLTELGINNDVITEYFNIKGSGFDYIDGSYTRMLRFIGSNITPVEFQIEVANGTNATSSNATWIGNKTNNDLRFGTNDSTNMILTTTGRLDVGTASPSAPLHVPSINSFTFGTGGSTVYRLRTENGISARPNIIHCIWNFWWIHRLNRNGNDER
ncbi:hypothetical protein PC110_g4285 [Phytophthora cactorum]|uniref:Uncharacterized protein n=1 Tax=Phytophthora cactorum TaxID=29920 RepID=A0A329SRN7_9STRA|nr:hypothetical protein PC110_g4285 [Phytophthora cactorum]